MENKKTVETREAARVALSNHALTRDGAKEIANRFVGTAPWSQVIEMARQLNLI